MSHFEQEIRNILSRLGMDEEGAESTAVEVEDFAWDNSVENPNEAVRKYMEQF